MSSTMTTPGRLAEALQVIVDAYDKTACAISDSDLDDEQSISVRLTLGDIRKSRRALQFFEQLKTSPKWKLSKPKRAAP